MNSMYYEDFEVGQRFLTSSRTITETDIINFVGLSGISNPLFIDEEYAKKSIHKSRIAPGPLTFSIAMGLFTRIGLFEESVLAFLGMDRMRLMVPVKPGDTIKVDIEITDKKETKKPDRGVLKEIYIVKNQRDETVMTYEMAHMVKRKQ